MRISDQILQGIYPIEKKHLILVSDTWLSSVSYKQNVSFFFLGGGKVFLAFQQQLRASPIHRQLLSTNFGILQYKRLNRQLLQLADSYCLLGCSILCIEPMDQS